MSNPYNNLAPLHTPEMFFGRAQLLRRIYATVTGHQSLSLVGTQRIGKSSVLIHIQLPEIQEQFDPNLSRYLFVYIVLSEYLHKKCDDFFDDVGNNIADVYQSKEGVTLPLEKGEDGLRNILERIANAGFYPVLLMDSFDNVTRNKEFDADFFSFLRAQATLGKVSYITASIAPLNEVCHGAIKGSPFFNIFGVERLEPLTRDETQALIMEPAAKAGHPFSPAEMEWIIAQVGYHPFFLQRVCYYIFEAKREARDNKIDFEALKRRIADELFQHFDYLWRNFSEEQREHLISEIRQPPSSAQKMPELSACPLFCAFLSREIGTLSLQISADDLEKALEKMADREMHALGESDLKHLRLVAANPSMPGGSVSAVERGHVISNILNKALEHMRGPGSRSDRAEDWRMYNILHYRYFKHRMRNEHVYARLGIPSIRTYYRERNKAIAELLRTLQDMEMQLDNL